MINPYGKTKTLPTINKKPYLAIAFDGCYYFLTMRDDRCIYRFSKGFTPKGEISTNKAYHGLCFDSVENCFWATEPGQHNKIFKLNADLQEIDCIAFENKRSDYKQILGISFDCAKNVLLVAFNDEVFEVSKSGTTRSLIKNLCPHVINTLAIPPYMAVAVNSGKSQSVLFFEGERHLETVNIPLEYRIRDLAYDPCEKVFLILATKHCSYPRVLYYTLDVKTDNCLKAICGKKCKPDKHCDDANVIKSIAKMETALSHILNVEGEKLQKAVAVADTVEELLEMNKSIHKTLSLASQLENILLMKLQTAMENE